MNPSYNATRITPTTVANMVAKIQEAQQIYENAKNKSGYRKTVGELTYFIHIGYEPIMDTIFKNQIIESKVITEADVVTKVLGEGFELV